MGEELKNSTCEAVLTKYKRDIKIQVIGIGGLSIVIICFIAFIVMGMVGSVFTTGSSMAQEYYTIDTEAYGNWDGHIELEKEELYGDSGLYIFPDTINHALDADYFYYCGRDNNSISQYLIYAAVTYSETDFEKEKERISSIECEISLDGGKEAVTNSIMYTEELFAYPSYIAIYASNLCYEYVLVNEEENQMIYIFTKLVDGQGIIPQEYLPIETQGKDMYGINSWENPNIYCSKNADDDIEFYDKY